MAEMCKVTAVLASEGRALQEQEAAPTKAPGHLLRVFLMRSNKEAMGWS